MKKIEWKVGDKVRVNSFGNFYQAKTGTVEKVSGDYCFVHLDQYCALTLIMNDFIEPDDVQFNKCELVKPT